MGWGDNAYGQTNTPSTLTNAIACRLDPAEQVQAAKATEEVTRGEEVGATSSWTSETRENVSGSSTVASKNQLADGTSCMNVTDVVIVEGYDGPQPGA